MAGIGGCGRIAADDRGAEAVVADRAGKSSVAKSLELAVPSSKGHPDFNGNVGVRSRRSMCHDTAEPRQHFVKRGQVRARELLTRTDKGPRGHRLSHGDFRVRKFELGKPLTTIAGSLRSILSRRDAGLRCNRK